ncbi:MAG: hypothetical protein J5675_01860 [Bacteroidales bacterium]|nr:hypothetical protein [Bacteroidales bacterium]
MKHLSIFTLLLMSVFITSCNKNGKDTCEENEEIQLVGDVISESELQGTWKIIGETCSKTITFNNGNYVITHTERGWEPTHKEYGTYTYEDGVITWKNTKYDFRAFDSFGTQDYTEWNTSFYPESEIFIRTAYVRSMYNHAVLIISEYVSPYSTYQYWAKRRNDDFVMIYYKEGADIPSDSRAIQGKWNWKKHYSYKDDEMGESITFKDNTFDYIKYDSSHRYTGTFTFVNGYLTLRIEERYMTGWSEEINDRIWVLTDKDWGGMSEDEYTKPFLPVADTTSYSLILENYYCYWNCIFVKE